MVTNTALKLIAPLLCVLVAGCYPIYKTLKPEAEIQVTDQNAKALQDARVLLIRLEYPYGQEFSRSESKTDSHGIATFQSESEWRTESLMIHGSSSFSTYLCVEKAGYKTYLTKQIWDNDDLDPLEIKLETGTAEPCPSGDPTTSHLHRH